MTRCPYCDRTVPTDDHERVARVCGAFLTTDQLIAIESDLGGGRADDLHSVCLVRAIEEVL